MTQRQTRLDAAEQERLAQTYVKELSAEFDINRNTVSAILERHLVERRHRVLDTDDITTAIRLYASGASLVTVAAHLRVNPSTIRNALLAAGVQTRLNGTNQWTNPT